MLDLFEFPAFAVSMGFFQTPSNIAATEVLLPAKSVNTYNFLLHTTRTDSCKLHNGPGIVSLFLRRCPLAITFAIAFVIVTSLKSCILVFRVVSFVLLIPCKHIIFKLLKVLPLFTNLYSSFTIIMKSTRFRILAALSHIHPDPVKSSIGHTVSFSTLFAFCRFTLSQITGEYLRYISTFTLAKKNFICSVICLGDNSPVRELIPCGDIRRSVTVPTPNGFLTGKIISLNSNNVTTLAFTPPVRSTFDTFKSYCSPFTKFLSSQIVKTTHFTSSFVIVNFFVIKDIITEGGSQVKGLYVELLNYSETFIYQGFMEVTL